VIIFFLFRDEEFSFWCGVIIGLTFGFVIFFSSRYNLLRIVCTMLGIISLRRYASLFAIGFHWFRICVTVVLNLWLTSFWVLSLRMTDYLEKIMVAIWPETLTVNKVADCTPPYSLIMSPTR
jgi:hypothetical protein